MFKVLRSVTNKTNKTKNSKPSLRTLLCLTSQNPFSTISSENIKNFSEFAWMASEEKMKEHLNILDWNKYNPEKIRDNIINEQKKNYNSIKKNYNDQTIYADFQKLKNEMVLEKQKEKVKNLEESKISNTKSKNRKNKLHTFDNNSNICSSDFDYLRNKPKNYLLVGGLANEGEEIDEVISLIKSQGQVIEHNIVLDLNGNPSLIEVYYYTDQEALSAKEKLNNYHINNEKHNTILSAYNINDYMDENSDNKTLIISELNPAIKQSDLADLFGKYGHVLNIELPIEIKSEKIKDYYNTKINSENYNLDQIYKLSNEYVSELEVSNNENPIKNLGRNFRVAQQLIKNFQISCKNENTTEKEKNDMLVKAKYFLQEVFPKNIVNMIINDEIAKTAETQNNPISDIIQLSKEKVSNAYEKIANNLNKLIESHKDKIEKMTSPLEPNQIPLNLFGNKIQNSSEDIDIDIIKKSAPESKQEKVNIINDFRDMNFIATFNPLDEQISKLKFYRSLSEQEKEVMKEKYDINLNFNAPSFIDFFLKFSNSIGVSIFEKHLELSNLFLSMSKLEQDYIGRKIAKKISQNRFNNPYNNLEKSSIASYLNLHKLKELKPVISHIRSRDMLRRKYAEDDKNMIFKHLFALKRKFILVKKFLSNPFSVSQKLNYLRENTKHVHKRKYNTIEICNQELQDIKGETLMLVDSINKVQDFKIREDFFKKLDDILTPIERKNLVIKKNIKVNPEGKEDNQLLHFKISEKIADLNIRKNKTIITIKKLRNNYDLKNQKYKKMLNKVKDEMREMVRTNFKDDPELLTKNMNKLEDNFSKLRYNTNNLGEKEALFEELVEDIVQRELFYLQKIKNVKEYFECIEEKFMEKIDKNNIVKILSVYDLIQKDKINFPPEFIDEERVKYDSPFQVYFRQVQDMFKAELSKVEEAKKKELENKDKLTIDETFNKRKELIEDYVNKRAEVEKILKDEETLIEGLDRQTKQQLEKYMLLKADKHIFSTNANYSDDESEILFKREILKKQFEIKENIKTYGDNYSTNIDSYEGFKEHFNKLKQNIKNEQGENDDGNNGWRKLKKMMNDNYTKNKGWAFITYSTADEAKKVFLSRDFIFLKKMPVVLSPKFELTHEHLDFDYIMKRAENDVNIKDKLKDMKEAESNLNEFEGKFKADMDKNHKDYQDILTSYRDMYSDPFKRHDEKNNPFDSDEEQEIKHNLKQQENTNGIDNLWLYEDKNLEKLRRTQDTKISKKYLDWELLKRGIVPEKYKTKPESLEDNRYDQVYVNNLISKDNKDVGFLQDNTKYSHGRNVNVNYGTKNFIEDYLGKDNLDVKPFKKTDKESVFYKEILELKDRFPKEKFLDKTPEEYQKLIKETNLNYIQKLKKGVNTETSIEDQVVEKLSLTNPINQVINTIEEERTNYIDYENNKDLLTLQKFYDQGINSNKIKTVHNNLLEYDHFQKSKILKEEERAHALKMREAQQEKPETSQNDKEETYSEYLARRKEFKNNLKEKDEKLKAASSETPTDIKAKNKNDISPSKNLESESDVIKSIRRKFETVVNENGNKYSFEDFISKKTLKFTDKYTNDLTKRLFNSNSNTTNKISNNNIYNSISSNNTQYTTSRNDTSKTSYLSEQDKKNIELERAKAEYLKEFSETFEEDYDTFPEFKEYFDSNNKITNNAMSNRIEQDYSQNETSNLTENSKITEEEKKSLQHREALSLLSRGKISPSKFKELFDNKDSLNNRYNEQFKKWINDDYLNRTTEREFKLRGKNTEEERQELLESIKLQSPYLFDKKAFEKYKEDLEHNQLLLSMGLDTEDLVDEEYYFDEDGLLSLEEHILHLTRQFPNTKISVKKDSNGKYIIKREFKSLYKYNLDDIINFNQEDEFKKTMQELDNMNLTDNILYNAEFLTRLHSKLDKIESENTNKKLSEIDYKQFIETLEHNFKVIFTTSDNSSTTPLTFLDFVNFSHEIFNMNDKQFKTLINYSISLLTHNYVENSLEVPDLDGNSLSNSGYKILYSLLKSDNDIKSLEILETNTDKFDAVQKFNYIQNRLLKSVISQLSQNLNEVENVLLHAFLNLLPSDTEVNPEQLQKIRKITWKYCKEAILKNETDSLVAKASLEDKTQEFVNSVERLRQNLKEASADNKDEVTQEIEEYSKQMKNFYKDMLTINPTDLNIEHYISDLELFNEEISEQMMKKMRKSKYMKKLSKKDLVKPRLNEETLLSKQISFMDKFNHELKTTMENENVKKNKDLVSDISRVIKANQERKKKLLREGTPNLDQSYPRLL